MPHVLEELIPVNMNPPNTEPGFVLPTEKTWFESSVENIDSVKWAQATDLAFFLSCQNATIPTSWTTFNQLISSRNSEQTLTGYLPIIIAPAHEYDTLNTVVKRCLAIANDIGQEYTVITVDQALYCRLMELKWCVLEYRTKLIPRLGELHVSMNFLKAIGHYMEGSGLSEV